VEDKIRHTHHLLTLDLA